MFTTDELLPNNNKSKRTVRIGNKSQLFLEFFTNQAQVKGLIIHCLNPSRFLLQNIDEDAQNLQLIRHFETELNERRGEAYVFDNYRTKAS